MEQPFSELGLSLEQIAQQVKTYQADPIRWVSDFSPLQLPWAKQRQILEAIRDHKWTLVKSCHASGKSWIASRSALWFLGVHPRSVVPTTAPTFRQVQEILWQEIRFAVNSSPLGYGGELLQTKLTVDDKWFAFGYSTGNPHAAQGIHADHIFEIGDEACGLTVETIEGIKSHLSAGHARCLLIGNPTDPQSEFARLWRSDLPDSAKITISAFDTPNFTAFGITEQDIKDGSWERKMAGTLPTPYLIQPAWVAEVWRTSGDGPFWRSRVLGEFPEQGEDTLIPLAWLERAVSRRIAGSIPSRVACDVARFGNDETVWLARDGNNVRVLQSVQGIDTQVCADMCVKKLRSEGAESIAVDVGGLGAGVVDRLKVLLGRDSGRVREVNGGEKAFDEERFTNKRAEMFWVLRDLFRLDQIGIPNHAKLISQLASLRYEIDSRGRIKIESKDDMKARGLPSPDHADCLAYLFAETKPGVDEFVRAMANQ